MPKIEDLPCSAKLVYKILELKGKATFQELKTETYMPERTLREALRILRDADLLSVEPCLGDTRSRVYSLSDVCVGLTRTERRKVED